MKIAIPCDNGNVFGHFGKTEQFKVYETEGKKILSSEVISSNGTGHGALAGMRRARIWKEASSAAMRSVTTIMKRVKAAAIMRKSPPAEDARKAKKAAADAAAVRATVRSSERMPATSAPYITAAPSMTAPSSILPMTGASRLNSYAVPA